MILNQHIEIEFKNLLTKQEFRKLVQHFKVKENSFAFQSNHYCDTETFSLKEKNSALRIRQRNGEYELTLKEPADTGLLETTQPLTRTEAESFLEDGIFPEGVISRLLENKLNIPSDSIRFFGTLMTNRTEFQYEGGLIVLDHSAYINTEDYEIEYEVSDAVEGKKIFLQLLKSLKIPVRETENKVKRFYRAKQGQ